MFKLCKYTNILILIHKKQRNVKKDLNNYFVNNLNVKHLQYIERTHARVRLYTANLAVSPAVSVVILWQFQ